MSENRPPRTPGHTTQGPLFAELLGSLSEAAFFKGYWAQRPLHVPHEPQVLAGLFGLHDLENYMMMVQPGIGGIHLVKEGQPAPTTVLEEIFGAGYSTQGVYSAFSEGYTIVLNFVHERWPPVKRLATHLEEILFSRVQVNVYVTGEHSRGFSMHSDLHDVFVLQTHGSKNWVVAQPQEPSNLEITLKEGDLLYIPQGFPHAAQTVSAFSIHLSVGVYHYTWLDLVGDAFRAGAAADPSWHRPVPWGVLAGRDPAPSVAEVEALVRGAFAGGDGVEQALATYRNRLADSAHRRNAAPSGYVDALRFVKDLHPRSRIMRRPGVGCSISTDMTSAYMQFLGRAVRAPLGVVEGLRFIEANKAFEIQAIDSVMSDKSKITLVRRLIREGLLQAADETPA